MLRGTKRKGEKSDGMEWGRGAQEGEGDDWKLERAIAAKERSERNKYLQFLCSHPPVPSIVCPKENPNRKPEGMGFS